MLSEIYGHKCKVSLVSTVTGFSSSNIQLFIYRHELKRKLGLTSVNTCEKSTKGERSKGHTYNTGPWKLKNREEEKKVGSIVCTEK